MAILRKPRWNYITTPIFHLRDTSLSAQAMGVFSFMLSCSDNFKFSIEGLTKCFSNGDTAIRSALQELKVHGYVVVNRLTDEQGKVSEWEYRLVANPYDENPDVENPHVENQVQSNNKISSNNKSQPLNNPTLFDNKDSIISPKRGKEYDLSFVADDFKPIFIKWLEYKREKKQTYKTHQSLKTCYQKLLDYSDNNVEVAEEIINDAIAYNYAGFFKPKNRNIITDTRPLEVRRDEFYDKVNAFLRTPEYAGEKELLYRFYNYWAQEKDGRMLWEMEPAFDIERRLRIEKSKRKK